MKYLKILLLLLLWGQQQQAYAQEEAKPKAKVEHAEPLYIDLIRDLGARKGEREWNLGFGISDRQKYDAYETLIEYEWAPIDRLGLEVELPFTFYSPLNGTERDSMPGHQLHGLKLAAQWSFFVSEKQATSMAIGYINEFMFSNFNQFGRPLIKGNLYDPFLVVAKRWNRNFHSLIYTGPRFEQEFATGHFSSGYAINTSIHYMANNSRNFVGIEFNKEFDAEGFSMHIRPQMRVAFSEQLIIGVLASVPIHRKEEGLGLFIRLIWEPKEKH